jgi:hypothetical protein
MHDEPCHLIYFGMPAFPEVSQSAGPGFGETPRRGSAAKAGMTPAREAASTCIEVV